MNMKEHMNDEQFHLHLKNEEKHISQSLRILVLDDNVVCVKVLSSQLKKCGYQVTTTTQAIETLKLLRENKDAYDILITDVVRLDIDGFKLLEIIALKMDIPMIMTSAYGDIRTMRKAIRYGAKDYLVKPVRMEVLQNIWKHTIRKPGLNANSGVMEAQADGNSNLNRQLQRDEIIPGQSTHESLAEKNQKCFWKPELHKKFVAIVEQLDVDKVVPKKILELMNEPKLTRANVSSHLQKYRNSLKKAKENTSGKSTRWITKKKILQFYNPNICATTSNDDLVINHNNNYNGCGMSHFTGRIHPFMLFSYNNIIPQKQKSWLTEYVNQRLKNTVVHMHQNATPDTTLATIPGFSAMRYQNIQNQRNPVGHKSSQITATNVGLGLPQSFPNLIVGNSSGTLSPIESKSFSCSSNSIGPTISHQVGYTQPFPTSNSVSGYNDPLTQTFTTASTIGPKNGTNLVLPLSTSSSVIQSLSQPFSVTSSVGINNVASLAIPFSPSSSSKETNVHHAQLFSIVNEQHAQLFPGGSSIGVNDYTHVALPLSKSTSVGQNNDYAQALSSINFIEENNGHFAQPFPIGSSVKENYEHHSQSFQVDSVVKGSNGYQAQPIKTTMGRNNSHNSQPFPDVSIKENNRHEMEVEDYPDDELSFLVKQLTDYTSPSI